MSNHITIRNVNENDAEALSLIYNHYIENSVITFEEETVDASEMATRIRKVAKEYPWLVWEDDGEVRGYAYASRWRERSAYRFACELTVYLHHEATGRGAGKKLYTRLIDELSSRGFHSLLGCVTLPNPASERLHAALGFEKVAHFHEAGYKFGRWLDVGYFEKLIPMSEGQSGTASSAP